MGKFSKILEKSGHSSAGGTIAQRTPGLEKKEGRDVEKGFGNAGNVHIPLSKTTSGWDERLTKVTSFSQEISESFRLLRSKILLPADGQPVPRSIMVTSAMPQEGKSFVSANLGISLAQGVDQHSLLVDCDLRMPTLGKLFGVPNDHGLVDFLRDRDELPGLILKTSVDKLSILPSGIPPVNPAELLGSVRMHDLVEELTTRYPDRFVIFDTPPMQVASESIVLSQVVDGVVLVVRQGIATRPVLERVIEDIGREKIIGVIFNGVESNFITSRLVNKSHRYYGGYYQHGSR